MAHISKEERAQGECRQNNFKKLVPFYSIILFFYIKVSPQMNIKRKIVLQDIYLGFSFPFQLQATSVFN